MKAHLIFAVKMVYSFINTTTVKEVPFQTSSKTLRCMLTLSCVRLFLTPWTVAHQVPLSMEFSMQEYWSGLPLPSPTEMLWHLLNFAREASVALNSCFPQAGKG